MDVNAALAAFAALSQPTRLEVVRLLVRAGREGRLAGEIAAALGVRQNTLSAHLAVLSGAGLVQAAREGRGIRYTADLEAMRGLIAFLMEDCCGGRPELCRPFLNELAATC
jgi:DNA-binding transcriptional ArsR family regulator